MSVYQKIWNYEAGAEDVEIGLMQHGPDGVYMRLYGDAAGKVFESEAAAMSNIRNQRGWPMAYLVE